MRYLTPHINSEQTHDPLHLKDVIIYLVNLEFKILLFVFDSDVVKYNELTIWQFRCINSSLPKQVSLANRCPTSPLKRCWTNFVPHRTYSVQTSPQFN
jgi:hypothetical protein